MTAQSQSQQSGLPGGIPTLLSQPSSSSTQQLNQSVNQQQHLLSHQILNHQPLLSSSDSAPNTVSSPAPSQQPIPGQMQQQSTPPPQQHQILPFSSFQAVNKKSAGQQGENTFYRTQFPRMQNGPSNNNNSNNTSKEGTPPAAAAATTTTGASSPATGGTASTPAAPAPKPPAPSTNPTRSSWVWKYFVQTPENAFRVQCQFRPSSSGGTGDICGVVLTRDKTGSTGSMCRHLSRVHQLIPSNHTGSAASTASSNSSANSAGTKNTSNGNNTNLKSSDAEKRPLEGSDTLAAGAAGPEKKKKKKKVSSRPTPGAANGSGHVNGTGGAAGSGAHNNSLPTFTPNYILSHVLPYYIETGIAFYEPDFHRLQSHLLATLPINKSGAGSNALNCLPPQLHSYSAFSAYASQLHSTLFQSVKNELAAAPGLISLCCGMWSPSSPALSSLKNRPASTTARPTGQLLVVTARYVDANWQLRRLLLKLVPVAWYSTSVVELVKSCASEYGILDRVFTVGIDASESAFAEISPALPSLSSIKPGSLFSGTTDSGPGSTAIFQSLAAARARLVSKSPQSSLPQSSFYFGLDTELGARQSGCGIPAKELVFQSPVALVSQIVDELVYSPKYGVLPLVAKLEMVTEMASETGTCLNPDALVTLPAQQASAASSTAEQLNVETPADPPSQSFQMKNEVQNQHLSADAKKRSQRKSLRDYDDDDDDDSANHHSHDFSSPHPSLGNPSSNANGYTSSSTTSSSRPCNNPHSPYYANAYYNSTNSYSKSQDESLLGWRHAYRLFTTCLDNFAKVQEFIVFSAEEHGLLKKVVRALNPVFAAVEDLKISSYDTAGVTAFAVETMVKSVVAIVKEMDDESENGKDNDAFFSQLSQSLLSLYEASLSNDNNLLFTCIEALDPNFKRVYWHMDAQQQERVCEALIKGVNWVNEKKQQFKMESQESVLGGGGCHGSSATGNADHGSTNNSNTANSEKPRGLVLGTEMGDLCGGGGGGGGGGGSRAGEAEDAGASTVTWNDILPSPVETSYPEVNGNTGSGASVGAGTTNGSIGGLDGVATVEEEESDGESSKKDTEMEDLVFGSSADDEKDIFSDKDGSAASTSNPPNAVSSPRGVSAASSPSSSSQQQQQQQQPLRGAFKPEEPSFFRTLVSQEKPVDTLEFQIREYLRSQTDKKFVDPYHWWAHKGQHQFPLLAKLAQTYLAVAGWNTVVHNQTLFEGCAVQPCSVKAQRSQQRGKEEGIGIEQEMCLKYWTRYYRR